MFKQGIHKGLPAKIDLQTLAQFGVVADFFLIFSQADRAEFEHPMGIFWKVLLVKVLISCSTVFPVCSSESIQLKNESGLFHFKDLRKTLYN